MKKVYIAGPISNLPENEARAAFQAAENKLSELGYITVNPMKLPHEHDKSWEAYMREDLREMLTCDEVWMLRGWKLSRGASMEHAVSMLVKIPVFYF